MDFHNEEHRAEALNTEMIDCIEKCMLCHQVVMQTLNYCLQKGGEHARHEHINSMLDCAQLTTVAADFMSRNSELHVFTCRACTEACLACALSCEDFGIGAEVMEACAEVCHRAAEACQKMAIRAQ